MSIWQSFGKIWPNISALECIQLCREHHTLQLALKKICNWNIVKHSGAADLRSYIAIETRMYSLEYSLLPLVDYVFQKSFEMRHNLEPHRFAGISHFEPHFAMVVYDFTISSGPIIYHFPTMQNFMSRRYRVCFGGAGAEHERHELSHWQDYGENFARFQCRMASRC